MGEPAAYDAHACKEEVLTHLTGLGIECETTSHEAAYTVEEMMASEVISKLKGIHAKNLFVKDKKGNKFLISAKHDQDINLLRLTKHIGAKQILRLTTDELLFEVLNVKQGSVNPFALFYDKEGVVKFVLDKALIPEDPSTCLLFHPMTNEATTAIPYSAFTAFLASIKHEPAHVVDFSELCDPAS